MKDWMQTEPKRCNHILGKVSHAIFEITGFVSLLHRLDTYSGMHMVFPLHRCLGCEGWWDQSVVGPSICCCDWNELERDVLNIKQCLLVCPFLRVSYFAIWWIEDINSSRHVPRRWFLMTYFFGVTGLQYCSTSQVRDFLEGNDIGISRVEWPQQGRKKSTCICKLQRFANHWFWKNSRSKKDKTWFERIQVPAKMLVIWNALFGQLGAINM